MHWHGSFLGCASCCREAAFARRRVIDPRAQSRRGLSCATVPPVGGRFRASKGHRPARAKLLGLFTRYGFPSGRPLSRVESGAKPPGESQRGLSPGPPRASVRLCERLQCGAALVAEGSSEFPLNAEAPLCKIAARAPLRVVLQPHGAGGFVPWEGYRRQMTERFFAKFT